MMLVTLGIISLKCLSSFIMTGLILRSWVLDGMLNIPPRSWETRPLTLGFAPSVKIGACLDMKYSTWRYEYASVSKFRIIGWKNEDVVGVVSIRLLDSELSLSILSNSLLFVSLCSVIC